MLCDQDFELPLKGIGGPGSNFEFPLVLTYVIALIFYFPEWTHWSLNSQRLPRYDATKMGTTRAFSAICIGKSPKTLGLKSHSVALSESLGLPYWL